MLCHSLKTRSGADVSEGDDSASKQSLSRTRTTTRTRTTRGIRSQQQEEYWLVRRKVANYEHFQVPMNTFQGPMKSIQRANGSNEGGDFVACAMSTRGRIGTLRTLRHCVKRFILLGCLRPVGCKARAKPEFRISHGLFGASALIA